MDYLVIVTCDKCEEEHALRIFRGDSVTNVLRNKTLYPIAWWQVFGEWAMLCKKCKEAYDITEEQIQITKKGFIKS